MKGFKEVYYPLLGYYKEDTFLVTLDSRRKETGSEAHVEFDWVMAMKLADKRGYQLQGMYHTHPSGFNEMSGRDKETMQAWMFTLGRPLLCLIQTEEQLNAWICEPGRTFMETGKGYTHNISPVNPIIFGHGHSLTCKCGPAKIVVY